MEARASGVFGDEFYPNKKHPPITQLFYYFAQHITTHYNTLPDYLYYFARATRAACELCVCVLARRCHAVSNAGARGSPPVSPANFVHHNPWKPDLSTASSV